MSQKIETQRFLNFFSTSTLGKVLSDFVDDYGENKKIDLRVFPS